MFGKQKQLFPPILLHTFSSRTEQVRALVHSFNEQPVCPNTLVGITDTLMKKRAKWSLCSNEDDGPKWEKISKYRETMQIVISVVKKTKKGQKYRIIEKPL